MLLLRVTSYLLLGILFWEITPGDGICRTTKSVPEHALTGHVISTLEGKRVETCVTSCERVQNCVSINYYPTSKRCELNNKTAEWYPRDVLPTQGALYLTMVLRDYTPCVDQNPPCFGTCVPVPGSLATRCVCEGNTTCQNDCKSMFLFNKTSLNIVFRVFSIILPKNNTQNYKNCKRSVCISRYMGKTKRFAVLQCHILGERN